MDRNSSFFPSKENSIELNNISTYKLKIKLNQNKTGEIIITNISEPEELAYNFCLKNNLDYHSLRSITKKIKSIQDTHFFKSKNIFKSISSKNNFNKKRKLKKLFLTDQAIYYNPKLERENFLKGFINKEVSLNDITIKEFNNFDSNNKSIQTLSNINFSKKLEKSKKNSENINQSKFSLSDTKYNIKDAANLNNSKDKNIILTTNIINQTIQNCLEMVEKDTKPFYNENDSEINITKNNISEIKLGSFITNNEKNNLNIEINNEKEMHNTKNINISRSIGQNDNNNFELDQIVIDKEKYNKNDLGSENFFENELKTIEQDIDTNISKTESENLTKNIILNNTNANNANTIPFSLNEKYFNNNLAISESININIPSNVNKEVNTNILSSPKIPFHNNYNIEEKCKKIFSKSNRCIPKSRHRFKNSIYNKSDSNNKNKNLLGLFNESSYQTRNTLKIKNKRPSSIYNNLQNKLINNKENICTPSTYVGSYKNSLTSLTVSDKNNLLLSIKENSEKNDILNRINKENLLGELLNCNNKNLNSLTKVNKNFIDYNINSHVLANSDNINEKIIKSNFDTNKYTSYKEKSYKFKKINEKINKQNNKDYNDINYYYFRTHDRENHKGNNIKQKRLLVDKNYNYETFSGTPSIQTSNHNNCKSNNLFNYNNNSLLKNDIFKHSNNYSAFFSNTFLINNLIKSSPALPHISIPKNQRFVDIKKLTDTIILKREIENSFKKIFVYISKNKEFLDAFWTMNGKTIPNKIFKPVHTIIKSYNKKRFISVNEFIGKGYQLFNSFPPNDKIAIMNFKIIT